MNYLSGTAIFAVAIPDVQHQAVGACHGDGSGIGMDGANAQRQQACGSQGDEVDELPEVARNDEDGRMWGLRQRR